jgi:hypothetical protein
MLKPIIKIDTSIFGFKINQNTLITSRIVLKYTLHKTLNKLIDRLLLSIPNIKTLVRHKKIPIIITLFMSGCEKIIILD